MHKGKQGFKGSQAKWDLIQSLTCVGGNLHELMGWGRKISSNVEVHWVCMSLTKFCKSHADRFLEYEH